MDQDYDVEMGDAEDYAMPEADSILPVDDDILPVDDAQEPGEVDESADPAADLAAEDLKRCPAKVHMRGVDSMNPKEIKAYFDEHAGGLQYKHIEWIDDSSANLVFASESSASEALIALSAIDVADPAQLPALELLPAKPCASKPGATLQVRIAVVGDRKIKGAAERSRFYLWHPEWERQNRDDGRNGGYRSRYRDRDRDSYDRRQRDDRHNSDRSGRYDGKQGDDEGIERFDASLYDDDQEALARREPRARSRRRGGHRYSRSRSRSRTRSRSRSGRSDRSDDHRRQKDNRGKELFPDLRSRNDRSGGSGLRGRSASPARSRDGDDTVSVASSRNRDKARAIKDRLSTASKDNRAKELFPSKMGAVGGGKAQMDQIDKVEAVSRSLSGMSPFSVVETLSPGGVCGGWGAPIMGCLQHQHQNSQQEQWHQQQPSGCCFDSNCIELQDQELQRAQAQRLAALASRDLQNSSNRPRVAPAPRGSLSRGARRRRSSSRKNLAMRARSSLRTSWRGGGGLGGKRRTHSISGDRVSFKLSKCPATLHCILFSFSFFYLIFYFLSSGRSLSPLRYLASRKRAERPEHLERRDGRRGIGGLLCPERNML
ncbi:hypothetical protein RB598_004059 [Gaeumannomyces tritici]